MSLRDLSQISTETETLQRPLRNISLEREDFFVTSLRRLKYISKKSLLCDVLRRLKHISQKRCLFRDVSETSQKHLSQVFVIFQKYPTKIISCDFRRVITISDKIDKGPLETLKKLDVFWEQCIDINQVCHEHQWAEFCVRVLGSQR